MKIYLALELSRTQWKVGFSDGKNNRYKTIKGPNPHEGLRVELARTLQKWGVTPGAQAQAQAQAGSSDKAPLTIYCIYEAGLDGFWIHRWLESEGITNLVVDPASIEVPRKARRNKTDRQDAESLLRLLQRYESGETKALSVVRVPSEEDEDQRRLQREIKTIQTEVTRSKNRITGLLAQVGLKPTGYTNLPRQLEQMRQWDGQPIPPRLRGQLQREWERMELANTQLKALEKERRQAVATPQDPSEQMRSKLADLCGVGDVTATTLVLEFFGWRDFQNVRQVGACAGLTGTAYQSGASCREQGISKAGNPRVRTVMVEVAWSWLRNQPDSELTQWFNRRYAKGSKRQRRVGIVALARKLLVAFWKYLTWGELPAGAHLKASAT
jgi:transposase